MLKGDNDIVVYENLTGEVHYSKHLPQPNNLNRYFLKILLRDMCFSLFSRSFLKNVSNV